MIRYWKIISVTALIALIIGIFYIQSAFATNNLPEFAIETTSGNEEEVNRLKLHANYVDSDSRQPLEITTEDTTYMKDLSFIDLLSNFHHDPKMKQLQEDYRNFLRGKEKTATSYFENEKMLVYAGPLNQNMNNFILDIEVLDKHSEEVSSFQIKLPEQNNNDFMSIEEVQAANEELKVFTRKRNDNGQTYHVYHIDLESQQLVDNKEIASTSQDGYISMINAYDDIGPKQYIVIEIQMRNVQQTDGEYVQEHLGTELIAYHVETGEQKKLALPNELQELIQNSSVTGTTFITESLIYFSDVTENGLTVTTYNMDTEQVENSQTVELPNNNISRQYLKDGKAYLISQTEEEMEQQPGLMIVDLNSGEMLYEGQIKMTTPGTEKEMFRLEISSLEIY